MKKRTAKKRMGRISGKLPADAKLLAESSNGVKFYVDENKFVYVVRMEPVVYKLGA